MKSTMLAIYAASSKRYLKFRNSQKSRERERVSSRVRGTLKINDTQGLVYGTGINRLSDYGKSPSMKISLENVGEGRRGCA